MQAQTYTLDGKEGDKVTLNKSVFGTKANRNLIAQAVRVHLGNRREGSAKTKTRGLVEGSTRKIFRQKGTGRARHGAIRAPIFVGGGISHGPDGNQNYSLTMPRKMSRAAMLGAIYTKADEKAICVISDATKATGKTKEIAKLWSGLELTGKSVLVVTTSKAENFNRAVRNIDRVKIVKPEGINVIEVLACKKMLITNEAMEELVKRYAA